MGTEVGVRVARQWFQRNTGDHDRALLKVDFENAFNTIDRTAFLQACRHQFPGLSPWVEWCYAEPTLLQFGSRTINSESGVQQGDPLGPLLFSLALQPLLASIKANHGLDLVFAYLDDCVLAGSISAVSEAFGELQLAASTLGIKVAMGRDKSLLVPCAGSQANITQDQFPSELCSQSDGNFELLGCPVGDDAFCRAHTSKRVTKACSLLKALGEVPDPAVALILSRHCASFGKIVFSIRLVPHTCHATALHEFDEAVFDCLETFLSASLSPEDRKLASLSTPLGGLGLRQSSKHCPGAYLASSFSSQTLCRKLDPAYALDFDNSTSDVSLAAADFNSSVLAEEVSTRPVHRVDIRNTPRV